MAAIDQEAGQRSAWTPVAEGALAERIAAVVIDLADALAERVAGAGDAAVQAEQHAEHALLRAYLACASGDEAHADAALDSLDRAIEALGAAAIRPALYGGFAGIAWMIEHVQEILGVGGEDGNAAIDAALSRMVDAGPWPFGHDIITGLAGIGVYALARAHRPGGEALLGRVVARLGPDEDSCFPARLTPGEPPEPACSAWCYGDPGIAIALLGAAERLGEPAWAQAALAAARKAAVRPYAATRVVDAGMCHGAAGLMHLFQRLFRATGEALFREAAHAWLARTLALRAPGVGIAGFRTWGRAPGAGDGAGPAWYEDPHLLSGATGIALALLAAVSPVEPAWDRLFVADL